MEAVEEAGAAGVQVEIGDALGEPQVPLDGARPRWGAALSALTVQPTQAPSSSGEIPARSRAIRAAVHRQGGGGLLTLAEMSGLDASAGAYPLVAGLHDPAHILVGDYFGRDAPPGRHDLQSLHGPSFRDRLRPIPRYFSYLCAA